MMRSFLHAAVFILTSALALAQSQKATGLFFDQSDLPELRRRYAEEPVFASLREKMQEVDRAKERQFLRAEVRYNDHLYDIPRVGNLAQQMAFLYIYTGDQDAAALAQECVETLMKFPKWDYFLEGGQQVFGLQRAPNSALAVAITVEALGDKIDQQTRDRWLRVMGERGTEPCFVATYGMRYPDRVKGWGFDPTSTYFEHRPGDRGLDLSRWPIILNTINLKAIPASVLAISAAAYRKYLGDDENTARWLEQAVYSLGTFRDIYKPDGSYSEGVSYANYTSLHLVEAIVALKRTTAKDLTDLLNWQGYVRYLLEMTAPTNEDPYDIINFSDASKGATSAVPFWVARQQRDGMAQWYGNNLAYDHDVWSVLWYDTSVAPVPPPASPQLWKSDLEWIVGRTGYGVQDLVIAMRSGGPSNHEHADRNSIIVKALGEKLVVDPHRPPYSFTDPAWIMRLTGGHSAVLIDGKGHQYVDGREGTNASQAVARLVRSGDGEGFLHWSSDATPAYQLVIPDVALVMRSIIMVYELPAVIVIDKVTKKSEASTVQARFYTYNNDKQGHVTTSDSSFDLIRPLAQLRGVSTGNVAVRYWHGVPEIPLEQAELYPYAVVSTAEAKKDIFLITVLLPQAGEGGNAAATITWNSEGGHYLAKLRNGNKNLNCLIQDLGGLPEFEIGKLQTVDHDMHE